jgi:hypothetical protein
MLLANSEIVGILPHTIRIESPEIRIPLPSNPQPLTLKMGQRQFANNIYPEQTPMRFSKKALHPTFKESG